MRIIFPLVLILFIVLQKKYKHVDFYKISLFLYFIFLSLRFMQGTDYYSYGVAYINEGDLLTCINHGGFIIPFEFLYELFVVIFRTLNLPFDFFISFISIVELYFINKFLNKFSKNKIISLLILYLVYGIVFMESALRQMLGLSIILGVCLVAFVDRNTTKLIIGILLSSLIHRSSFAIGIFILTLYIVEKRFGYKNIINFVRNSYIKIFVFIIMCFAVATMFPFEYVNSMIGGTIGEKISVYFSVSDYSYFAIFLRVVILLLTIFLLKDKIKKFDYRDLCIFSLYLFGFIFYFIFCRFSMISRMTVYFEILEIIIFANLIDDMFSYKSILKKTALLIYCCIIVCLFVKDGISTQVQSNYYEVKFVCPYYNIFQKKEAVSNIYIPW